VVESPVSESDRACPTDWDPAIAANIAVAVDHCALELRISILTTAIATSLHLGFRQKVNEILGGEELDLPLSADLDPLKQTESLTDTQEKIGTLRRRETVSHAPTHDPICQLLRRVRR